MKSLLTMLAVCVLFLAFLMINKAAPNEPEVVKSMPINYFAQLSSPENTCRFYYGIDEDLMKYLVKVCDQGQVTLKRL